MQHSPSRVGALVIVTGLPASGKSRFAADLAARTGLAVFGKDAIKEALFERLGTGDAAWSRHLSAVAFAGLFARAARRLRGGAALVLEGNFRHGEHEAPLLAALGAAAASAVVSSAAVPTGTPAPAIAQVLCRVAEPQRVARVRARAVLRTRHPGHRDAEALVALQGGVAAGLGAPSDRFLDLPGLRLVYDSGQQAQPQHAASERVLDELVAWLDAGADGGPSRHPSRRAD